jgi:hypothetical protein
MHGTSQDRGRSQSLDPFAGMILAFVFALGILGGTVAYVLHPNEVLSAQNVAAQNQIGPPHPG